jgi:hypothetical protein
MLSDEMIASSPAHNHITLSSDDDEKKLPKSKRDKRNKNENLDPEEILETRVDSTPRAKVRRDRELFSHKDLRSPYQELSEIVSDSPGPYVSAIRPVPRSSRKPRAMPRERSLRATTRQSPRKRIKLEKPQESSDNDHTDRE